MISISTDLWLDTFQDLLRKEARHASDPKGFAELISGYHFSVTQQLQLRRVLQQGQALGKTIVPKSRVWKNGNDCLRDLREELKRAQSLARDGDEHCV